MKPSARGSTTSSPSDSAPALARLVPTQQRSRERFEKILSSAAELMAEKGSEAFRMSDVVERSGVPFGSLYQYFPDKTAIIGTLAERYNAVGRDCVRRDLPVVRNARDLHPALCRIQPFRLLYDCSGCFRLERLPGGTCTHWKAPPFTAHTHSEHFVVVSR
jgi:AcrR family transcriptional regulator